ncbi:MAG: sigma-70 family RNA polymerase sigma factor, partial [Opitutaceae bacterium]
MTDDAELLRRYVELHSEADFTAFVERHLSVVYHAALRRTGGRSDLARDASQYVFIALARDAARLSRHETITGWLYTTTRHAVLRIVRAERRRQRREEEAQIVNSANTDPLGESDPAWQEVREQLDGIMDELPARDREAILLRFFHDRPFARIGAAFGSSEEAARKRVERAVEELRRRLKRRGVTSTATALATMLSAQAGLAAPAGLAQSVASGALAVAGAGTVGAAGAVGIFIMNTSKAVTGISAVVALAAIGTAVYQNNASRDFAAALISVAAEHDTWRARVATTEQRAKQSEAALAAMQKELDDLRTAATKPETKAPAPPAAVSSAGTVDYVLAHPETHAAFVEQQVLSAKARYERFVQAAGLSAAQQDAFFKNIRARSGGALDFMLALREQGY